MAFSSPILHPSVPFLQYFHTPLRGGMSICIIGQVLHSAKGFAFTVNLLGENGDIVFHFNPRMNENEVVCNTKQNGGWGKEERWPIPFEAGATFMMIIDVMSDCYRVTVNKGLLGNKTKRGEKRRQCSGRRHRTENKFIF
ncbi:galectin-9 isoform X1 [Podarcis lilfordi]|uniref:Galectin n=1 Tax=Podarcis lilfordi TaxID=74358 RepID=A0AA35KNN4_9SAUR|nr:galectin-9 isoform X1 [Podarcis lilfordi]